MRTRFRLFLLIITFLIGAVSCQSRSPSTSIVWTKGAGSPPALFHSSQFSKSENSIMIGSEIVRFSRQRWGPAVIEGGSLQKIETAKGDWVYGKMDYEFSPESDPDLKIDALEKLNLDRFVFLEKLNHLNELPKGSKVLSQPQLVLAPSAKSLRPAYALDVLSPNKKIVERYWITPGYVILRHEQISSDFDTDAWIYTTSETTAPQDVLMKNLIESSSAVTSNTHQVTSASNLSASPLQIPWKFDLTDPRFDQIQAYYFIQAGLELYRKNAGLTVPVFVQVETSLGYPDKTSAAFTYGNEIRLGDGDGVAYGPLARDPSIVIHELGHVVTGVVAHLPTTKEGGSLNEAFADFFAASFLDNPKMGQKAFLRGPYARNLEDFISAKNRTGGLYHDSQIVSGTLWEIRGSLGAVKTQNLALRTLARLGPSTKLDDFPAALKNAMTDFLTEDEIATVNQILARHEWAL